jgi:hypothetical protein
MTALAKFPKAICMAMTSFLESADGNRRQKILEPAIYERQEPPYGEQPADFQTFHGFVSVVILTVIVLE